MSAIIRILGDTRRFTVAMDKVGRKIRDVEQRLENVNRTADKLSSVSRKAFLATALIAAPLVIATKQAAEFDKAMAEVSTLGGTPEQMKKLTEQTLDLAKAFGSNEIITAKAVYQAISSGAVDASNANELLTIAGKLAVGGITSLDVAVDGLTTSYKAFGVKGLEVTTQTDALKRASDLLFISMKFGKTTVGELSGVLGDIAPIAKGLGLTMGETVAAISAMTVGGVSTSQAMTNLKSILIGVIRNQGRAEKVGKGLSKVFSLQALKAKGLQKFIIDLNKATGGNAQTLVKLIGRQEGFLAIQSLAGEQAKDFDKILKENSKTLKTLGETSETAFRKIDATPFQRMAKAMQAMRNASIKLGIALFPVLEKLTATLEFVADIVEKNPFVAWLGAGAVAAGALTFAITGTGSMLIRLNSQLSLLKVRAILAAASMRTLGRATKGVLVIGLALGALALLGGKNLEEELEGKTPEEQLKFLNERLKKQKQEEIKIRERFGLLQGQFVTPTETLLFTNIPAGRAVQAIERKIKKTEIAIKLAKELLNIDKVLDPSKITDELAKAQAGLDIKGLLGEIGIPDIEAPKANRIVRVDELNINLQIPENVDPINLVDLLANIFERELLNADAIAP